MICTSDTPEGEACGLVKNLALMTHITTDDDEQPIIRLAFSLGVEDISLVSGSEIHPPDARETPYLVFLNGDILGLHRSPAQLVDNFRKLRRAGRISEFVSIYTNASQNCVHIASDCGRICRPIIIVDSDGQPRVTSKHIKDLIAGKLKFPDFLRMGLIEYLDVNEENDSFVAIYEREISPGETTHLEIEPFTVLGAVAGLIPYPHHNQSPRNTYQCAMGKQAMGSIGYNQLNRFDTLLYLLTYPQQPMVKTRTIELIGFDKLPAGQNATVAVMSFSGYDIEDALVVNKSSLDRGFGRCIVIKKFQTNVKQYSATSYDRVVAPVPDSQGNVAKKFEVLDVDGIGRVAGRIEPGQVYVNKQEPVDKRADFVASDKSAVEYRPTPLVFKSLDPAVIDKVPEKNNRITFIHRLKLLRVFVYDLLLGKIFNLIGTSDHEQ
jgi:DNA-directed RNA polymerase III subunit RPC2